MYFSECPTGLPVLKLNERDDSGLAVIISQFRNEIPSLVHSKTAVSFEQTTSWLLIEISFSKRKKKKELY